MNTTSHPSSSLLPKAVIFGCEGTSLTPAERSFFERTQPLGFILFLRNCQTPDQVKSLVIELKACVNHDYVPILIDQEGGRVARLKSPHWREYPEASLFGKIADEDMNLACWAVETNAFLIGAELQSLGINVNCAPLLDLFIPHAHQIIGSRAFHESPEICASLGYYALKGFQKAGIVPIIKHLPGHGRALLDSHEELPHILDSLEELTETDFDIFSHVIAQNKDDNAPSPWGMSAHIIYNAIDSKNPATLSEKVISKIIRQNIGFEGFLVTDCLTMKALRGDMGDNAIKAINAGCNAVLHCSGSLDDMITVAAKTPCLSQTSQDRLKAGMVSRHFHDDDTQDRLWIEFNYYLKEFWGGEQQVM